MRSDNGPEYIAQAVRDWIAAVGAKTAYIKPGSHWENGYCESFNARLNGEVFYSLHEAQILIGQWPLSGHCHAMPCRSAGNHYNTKRPQSALGYRPPAPEAIVPMVHRPTMHVSVRFDFSDAVRSALIVDILGQSMAGKKDQKKRSWSDDEKRSICDQARVPGVSVAQVARRYSMNANLIHKWLRDPRFAPSDSDPEDDIEIADFLEVAATC